MALFETKTTYDTDGAAGYVAADGKVLVLAVQTDGTSGNPGIVEVVANDIDGNSMSYEVPVAVGETEYIRSINGIISTLFKGDGGSAIMSYWPAVV